MKKRLLILILAGLCLILTRPAYAYWLWTPKTGRWINPKYSVKPTPKEQLKYAQELFEQSKYKESISESNKLIKYYPKAYEASDAQFLIGSCLDTEGLLYEAYLAYQKVIDKYPFTTRIEEILEKELKIAQAFMAGYKRKALGLELPVENPAIEIFRKIVDNSPYGKGASKAQYLLGMVLKNAGRNQEAKDEFEKVVTSYPDSELANSAKFQVADCAGRISPKADYDQEFTKEAKKRFEEFVKVNPDTVLSKEAQGQIDSLKEKEAQGNLATAEFYEKQKKYESARIYYQAIVDSCSYCLSATQARERLKELEKK